MVGLRSYTLEIYVLRSVEKTLTAECVSWIILLLCRCPGLISNIPFVLIVSSIDASIAGIKFHASGFYSFYH